MGAVYLAQHILLNSYVAVKEMLDLHTDPVLRSRAVQQFQQEARLLFHLQHVNLPRVSDFFTEGGRWYLVLEYVDGETLGDLLLRRGAPFAEGQIIDWASQLCDVLGYLHGLQPPVVFRDLKPANVMLAKNGRLKLIDFGIARFFNPMKAADTVSMGTTGYAPPEQYAGSRQQSDARSDIYALGATLYHLATGRDPSQAPFTFQQYRPRTLNPALSSHLENVILRAVENDPARRFQSANEMRTALVDQRAQVVCPRCQATNRQGARFCVRCGGTLLAPTVRAAPFTTRTKWVAAGVLTLTPMLLLLLLVGAWWLKVGPFSASATPTGAAMAPATITPTSAPTASFTATRQAPSPTATPVTAMPLTPTATRQAPSPTATRTPIPTPSLTPTPVVRLLYSDDFGDPSTGWAQSSDEAFDQDYEGGEYSLLGKKPNYYCSNCRRWYADFALEIDAEQKDTSLERYGLMFRGQDKEFYTFRVARDGTYTLGKHTARDGFSTLHGPTRSSAIKVSGVNRLRVVAKGAQFTLYVNGQLLTTITDTSFKEGCIGFIACTCDGSAGVHVHFDNLKVYSTE
jgi:hypothetical protein